MRTALLSLALSAVPAAALEWAPVASVEALGGAHRFDGQPTQLSGNASALFAPAARLDERWTLLPSARAAYEGTRRAADVLGAATPAAERLESRLAARAVYAPAGSPWRLKPGVSYKLSWLKETRDEEWGKGLFDERLWTVGLEAERPFDARSLRLSLDWFDLAYPNYTTLESQAALQFHGDALARELVGDRALDRHGLRAAAALDGRAGPWAWDAGLSAAWSLYPQQRVVDDAGQLAGGNRQDFLTSLSLAARRETERSRTLRLRWGAALGFAALSSSQNGYDASQGRFLSRSYDYRELSLTPSLRALLGEGDRPSVLDASLRWKRRDYPHRPAQDGLGAYTGGALATTEWTLAGSWTQPLSRRLSLVVALERVSASSNQRFERFYRYAYEATSLLAGARWEW